MDKKGGLAKTHTKAVKVIEDYIAELDLVDAWRLLNPDGRRYTWPEIHRRLDFFSRELELYMQCYRTRV